MAKARRRSQRALVDRTGARPPAPTANLLLGDIRSLIQSAREQAARAVNTALVSLYWHIGKRIREDVLQNARAGYGDEIISALGRQLTEEFGRGFSGKSLWHMVRFAEVYPDEQIVSALRRELSWTHFKEIIYLDDPLKRDFTPRCAALNAGVPGRCGTRSTICSTSARQSPRSPTKSSSRNWQHFATRIGCRPDLVFRDPYFLDFLGLTSAFAEKDVEQAILRELEVFILELGSDFAFVTRQKRISVDSEDYYLDLLFYHRRLRRLVAIDLKIGKFQAAGKGQMELYLRWLEKREMQSGENEPLGLILCADKSGEHVELLQLEKRGIRVAQYLAELPPRKLLEQKLHDSIRLARAHLAQAQGISDDGDATPVTKSVAFLPEKKLPGKKGSTTKRSLGDARQR